MPIRRLMPLALLALLAAVLVVPAPAGAATRIDVETKAQSVLSRITARTDVAVYLPTTLTIGGTNVRSFAWGGVIRSPKGWQLGLDHTRNCHGANACDQAYFFAAVGERPFGRARVQLARGVVGRYEPMTCGASCGSPSIQFVLDGVLYGFSVADPAGRDKLALINLANQAIRYGPR